MEKVYHTKQRDLIIEFFENNKGRCFTSRQIIEESGLKLGEATVFRLLKKLTEQGIIKQFISDKNTGTLYQYNREECANHFHMKCLKCSKVFHTECESIKNIEKHIEDDHGFIVDNGKTVFYGICKECSEKDK